MPRPEAGRRLSEAAAGRVEQLQRRFADLKADDAFVEDYAYEWIFGALEAEAGSARPERIDASIEALRKTGAALRKLATLEPKSADLLKKLEALQKRHDDLFREVQAAATEALETVKGKYKGEANVLETHLKQLAESPLVRGVERAMDTPEARVEALKQEISELFLRPAAEERLKPNEKQLEDVKTQLIKLPAAYEEKKKYWSRPGFRLEDWSARGFAEEMGIAVPGRSGEVKADNLDNAVYSHLRALEERRKDLELLVQRDRLAFEYNRALLGEILDDEREEAALLEAFADLRTVASLLQRGVKDGRLERGVMETWNGMQSLQKGLAGKILGHYQQYGASLPEGGAYRSGIERWSPTEQIAGRPASQSEGRRGVISQFQTLSRAAFIESRVPGATRSIGTDREVSVDLAVSGYRRLDPGRRTEDAALASAYPDAEAFVAGLYSGEGGFINLQRAYREVDAGLVARGKPAPETLPEPLAKAGWKESKLGAVVEPGQEARAVDKKFTKILERLSGPQVQIEQALDSRSPEGEYVAYTLGQAMSLIRRIRRDAARMVEDTAKKEAAFEETRKQGENAARGLGHEMERLNAQIARSESESRAAAGRERDLSARLTAAEAQAQAEREAAGQLRAGVQEAHAQLWAALAAKSGFLGGEKQLRNAVEAIMKQLEALE